MKKLTAAVLMAGSAAVLGSNAHYELSRYGRDKIWSTQTLMIDRHVRNPQDKARRIEDLRSGLAGLGKDAGTREYCRFQLKFEAVTRNHGDVRAAEADVARRSFKPYSECESDVQSHNFLTSTVNLAAIGVFLLGVYGMVRSLFRRKTAEENHIPSHDKTGTQD